MKKALLCCFGIILAMWVAINPAIALEGPELYPIAFDPPKTRIRAPTLIVEKETVKAQETRAVKTTGFSIQTCAIVHVPTQNSVWATPEGDRTGEGGSECKRDGVKTLLACLFDIYFLNIKRLLNIFLTVLTVLTVLANLLWS